MAQEDRIDGAPHSFLDGVAETADLLDSEEAELMDRVKRAQARIQAHIARTAHIDRLMATRERPELERALALLGTVSGPGPAGEDIARGVADSLRRIEKRAAKPRARRVRRPVED